MRRLLVCDLDNTLYDWTGYFIASFYAMVDEAVKITGCSREQLLDDFRDVHQRHNDSEHPFALLETKSILDRYDGLPRDKIAANLDAAFRAFNQARKQSLRLYPGVKETLEVLTEADVTLVAHTESKLYAVVDRLTRLDLTKYFNRIYCRERPASIHPNKDTGATWLDRFPMDLVVELSHHQRKPSPDVLIEICDAQGVQPKEAAYVGDSMARDMLMAKRAGVFAIWAKYGAAHAREEYASLVRVTHWTQEDVAREKVLAEESAQIQPDYVLKKGFDEVLDALKLKFSNEAAE